MATQDAHKELFLDMLTKEEKEALLTKKMESLRKQNEAIQKRYAEVEADKKRADVKLGSKIPAQKETHVVPRAQPPQSEDHDPRKIKQTQQQQQQLQQQNSRPATRNKPPPAQGGGGGGGGRGARERPKSQDFRSDAAYEYEPIVDIADLDSRHAKRALSPSKARRNAPKENTPVVSNSTHTSLPPEGASEASSNFYRPPRQGKSHGNRDDQSHDSPARGGRGGHVYTQTFSGRKHGRDPYEDGPPPDPAYNYLADRTRDSNTSGRQIEKSSSHDGSGGGAGGGGGGSRGGKDPRRHPRNFGGPDFNNVRQQMKTVKEKEKDRRSFPPRNRLEMSVNMTGTERIQYDEWKAERQKVDQERIDRQKTTSGEWRRAWDQEKHHKEYEEPPSPGRTEPARRPVGRIGSGRFDRGDRDDRRAEGLSQSPKAPSTPQNIAPPEISDRKPSAGGRGRGRGRGRARVPQGGESGRPGEKPPRPRTWSGGDDSRTVECSNDMLVVKIDKSRSSDDHSVEVEYEVPDKRKSSPAKKKPARRSPTKQKQQQHLPQPPQFQDADILPGAKGVSPPLLHTMSSQDSSIYEGRPASLSQSLSVGSTDEWEDMTGTDSYATTTEDEGEGMRRSGKLNPEAPVFQPSSPDLALSPPVKTGFSLPPKEQRSPRVAGGLTGSLNVAASSFSGPAATTTTITSPKPAPPASAETTKETAVNGKAMGADEEEEEEDEEREVEEEEATPEREVMDVEQEDEEDEEEEDDFQDSEDKVDKEGEEDFDLPAESHDTQVEKEEGKEEAEAQGQSSLTDKEGREEAEARGESSLVDKEGNKEAEAQGESSLADELSASGPASSLADELSAAGAPRPHSDGQHAHQSVQDHPTSQEVYEIEEDDVIDAEDEERETVSVEENKETVPVVTDDTGPKGESLPTTATASDKTEIEVEKKQVSVDADPDGSCSSAPADGSSDSSPKPSGKQMAANEEDGGSQDGAVEPSSSQLTSSASEGTTESAPSDVMEKPDAEHVNGDTIEATAASEDSVATETTSTTSLSA